ncbi:MAG: Txe/YoeB family addiction module toxin [Saprospiraceae bacterium]|nr:Txe/YoeB family addiction module toxin [Saprospiraceae bacterium]
MEVRFSEKAKRQLEDYKSRNDSKSMDKIKLLLKSITKEPFSGIGKPEPLKFDLKGLWSRRININDRLVYEVKPEYIFVFSIKGHYEL